MDSKWRLSPCPLIQRRYKGVQSSSYLTGRTFCPGIRPLRLLLYFWFEKRIRRIYWVGVLRRNQGFSVVTADPEPSTQRMVELHGHGGYAIAARGGNEGQSLEFVKKWPYRTLLMIRLRSFAIMCASALSHCGRRGIIAIVGSQCEPEHQYTF
jgi:hypothetical protein